MLPYGLCYDVVLCTIPPARSVRVTNTDTDSLVSAEIIPFCDDAMSRVRINCDAARVYKCTPIMRASLPHPYRTYYNYCPRHYYLPWRAMETQLRQLCISLALTLLLVSP